MDTEISFHTFFAKAKIGDAIRIRWTITNCFTGSEKKMTASIEKDNEGFSYFVFWKKGVLKPETIEMLKQLDYQHLGCTSYTTFELCLNGEKGEIYCDGAIEFDKILTGETKLNLSQQGPRW